MNKIATILFKYRSYTPIPFLILMLIFLDASLWSLITGFTIALLGETIRLWGVSWAGSETRTTGEVDGTYLIISGPFAYVRNPLYVGNILIYLGLGVMSFALFPFLQLGAMLFFVFQYYFIVKEEENYLKNTYGKDYQNYCENVPAFVPRFTPYKNTVVEQPSFKLKAGLRSEKRTLQAFIGISAAIVIMWLVNIWPQW